jgi:hypothetical protein
MRRYKDKLDWILPFVRGERILYLGSVDRDPGNIRKHTLLHKAMIGAARQVVAVYHFCDRPEELCQRPDDTILLSDMEHLDLKTDFKIILSADNIEHFSNCGNFLERVSEHLAKDGRFLVTSPNPSSMMRIMELLALGAAKTNCEHTCWFTRQVLDQLSRRHGMEVVAQVFIDDMQQYHTRLFYRERYGPPGTALRTLVLSFNSLICSVLPQFSETLGYVLMKRKVGGRHDGAERDQKSY